MNNFNHHPKTDCQKQFAEDRYQGYICRMTIETTNIALLAEVKRATCMFSTAQIKNLSMRSGVNVATIYRISRGLVNSPRGNVLRRLARALELQ